MSKFEIVSRYANSNINLPKRATANAAGYDFEIAEDCMLPSYASLMDIMKTYHSSSMTLDEMAEYTKEIYVRPTLVPTGIKCQLEPWEYLELSVRSSLPLKHWIILANGVGIVDADYYNNKSNEGEIYFQLINLSPFNIYLKKGDRIGQGIIKTYGLVEGDEYEKGAKRVGGFGSSSIAINKQLEDDEYKKLIESFKKTTYISYPVYETSSEVNYNNTYPYIIQNTDFDPLQLTFKDILNTAFDKDENSIS